MTGEALPLIPGVAVPLSHWLVLTAALFAIGVYGLITRRNVVGVLMAVELMLNAAALNFAIFNRSLAPGRVDGEIMSIFVIAVAAAEVVVAMAIFVSLYKHRHTADVTQLATLKA